MSYVSMSIGVSNSDTVTFSEGYSLLVKLLSFSVELTDTTFSIVPFETTLTTKVNVETSSFASSPIYQLFLSLS